jgi:sterol desaturase/sphingolipid hydroxylase (fatty acid hydroxylase superfamily)
MSWNRFQGPAYWLLFVGVFLAVAVWESLRPRSPLDWPTERRWGRHAMILALAVIARNVLLPVSAVAVAVMVSGSRFGILSSAWLPFFVRCALTVLLLDLARYGIHRAFHALSFLWRIHEVHHSDPDYDVSTAGRFHPLEVVLEQGALLALIALLAPPPIAVFGDVLITVALNLFVHANASLPVPIEKALRKAIVTPDLHRIHHSERIQEQSRNFGQTFSWWDRLFGTFLAGAAGGESGLITGIMELRNGASLGLGFMLAEPFRRRTPEKTDPAS